MTIALGILNIMMGVWNIYLIAKKNGSIVNYVVAIVCTFVGIYTIIRAF